MKRLLLAGALAVVTGPAFAACIPQAPIGNIQPFQCDSDNQATDADDLKLFINKATGVTNIDGSLDKNSQITIEQNIHINTDAPVNQEGNGFAELHSANAGSPSNALHNVTFTPIADSVIKGDGVFPGFDGFLGRGQVDPLGPTGWDGVVTMSIVFSDASTLTLTFNGDTAQDDVGAIGFDEIKEPGLFVSSVTMSLDSTGAWNEVKQFDFSVPGAVSTIPETRTWAMTLLGFAALGCVGFRRRRLTARFA